MKVLMKSIRLLKNRGTVTLLDKVISKHPETSFTCRSAHRNAPIKKPNLRNIQETDEPKGYALLTIPVIAFGLGTWQIYRKQWKEGLIRELENKTRTPPVGFPEDLEELRDLEYRKVHVRGRFDHSREIYLTPRSLIDHEHGGSTGPSGSLVITPFQLSDRNLTILVNRGWVPRKLTLPKNRQEGQVEGEVEFDGIVRMTESRPVFSAKNDPNSEFWHFRDLEKMAKKCGCDPIWIDADLSSSVPGGPIGGQTRVSLRNEHLSYILTWYSLALLTGFLWHQRFVRKIPLM